VPFVRPLTVTGEADAVPLNTFVPSVALAAKLVIASLPTSEGAVNATDTSALLADASPIVGASGTNRLSLPIKPPLLAIAYDPYASSIISYEEIDDA